MTLSALNPNLWLRRMYDWVMEKAEHPHSTAYLYGLATIEAIFFPIPVDPLLMAIGAARPRRALWYAFVASLYSVLGGVIGYILGYLFWESTQQFFFSYVFSAAKFDLVMAQFNDNAFWAMFLAGFTPIPFKVFTLAAGVAQINIWSFLTGSLLSRSLRFCIEGGLIHFFGPHIRGFIEKYFEKITLVTGIVVLIALIAYNYIQG